MNKIESINEQLSKLPKGYISEKTIKNKKYFYLQYLDNGKLVSKYISKKELDKIKDGLKKRKDLEKELKDLQKQSHVLPKLSDRAKKYTGCLMSGDTITAKFNEGHLTYIDEEKCPLYIKRTGNIEKFLENRCIDLSRPNARILLKFLNVFNKNEALISLYSYGSCISDNFWFKPSGSKKTYKDINFNNDLYSDIALNGGIPQFHSLGSASPELTNTGSFEKCWKLIGNEWWMFKKGDEDQIFSEIFSSKLAALLGIKTAIYEYDEGNIKTKNFASQYNFEPMYSLCDDDEEYIHVFNILRKFGDEIAKDYILLLFFDCIVYNIDRHNNNYGLLRDRTTGKVISLAPNFDNNLSLLAYNKTLSQDPKTDGLIKFFTDFLKKCPEAMALFRKAKINQINEEDIRKIIKDIPIKEDEKKIINFIIGRYNYLLSIKDS